MLQTISELLAKAVFGKSSDNRELEIYGLKLLVSSGFSQLIIILVGFLTGTFFESILFLIFFSALRIFIGGYHAKSYLSCFIISVATYLCCVLINKILYVFIANWVFQLIVFVLSYAIICLKQSADNDKRSKIIGLFILSIEISIFFLVYYIFEWKNILIFIPTLIAVDFFLSLSKKYIKGGEK